MKFAIYAMLLLMSLPVHAQTIKLACASPATCQFITDPFDLAGPQPQTCKLFKAGQTTPIITSSVTSAPAYVPGAPVGSVLCSFTSTFAPGTYTLTAVASRAGFTDSAPSVPYIFDSVAPPPVQTPNNLHPRNAVIVP